MKCNGLLITIMKNNYTANRKMKYMYNTMTNLNKLNNNKKTISLSVRQNTTIQFY